MEKSTDIIRRKFEIIASDKNRFSFLRKKKCIGELIVDRKARTITFRHLSGKAPTGYIVIAAMGLNNDWIRVLHGGVKYEALTVDKPVLGYFAGNNDEDGVAVINKQIRRLNRGGIRELTLTVAEFNLLAGHYGLLMITMKSTRKLIAPKVREELGFRYIRA